MRTRRKYTAREAHAYRKVLLRILAFYDNPANMERFRAWKEARNG